MKYKFLLVFVFTILLLGSVSAFDVKVYDDKIGDYGSITIESRVWFDPFGWIFDKNLVEYNLIENSDKCLINCYAEGTAVVYEDNILFSGVEFSDIDGKVKEIEKSKFFIQVKEEYNHAVFTGEKICELYKGNLSQYCYDKYSFEVRERYVWKEYNYEILEQGTYNWRIEGKKKPEESIDWVAISGINDIKLKEWAMWDAFDGTFVVYNTTGADTFVTPVGVTNVSVLVIGGGAGGSGSTVAGGAGGGGAGGLIFNNSYAVSGTIQIYVGSGGTGGFGSQNGFNGTNSTFGDSIAYGGGGGGEGEINIGKGLDGASAGGQGSKGGEQGGGGLAVYGSQGNDGGAGIASPIGAGGGGGHGAVGDVADAGGAGDGGAGSTVYNQVWAGGGGGGGQAGGSSSGAGGIGGGGAGASTKNGFNGTDGYGGGGGGALLPSGALSSNGGDGGDGIVVVRYFIIDAVPNIVLSHPANNSNFTSNSITFSGLVSDGTKLENVSLYIEGVRNQTNSSGFNNSVYNFTEEFADGTYNWYYDAWDNSSGVNTTRGMRFYIDTSAPSLNVTSPHGIIDYQITGENINLDWNYSDASVGICRYQYKGVNTTVTCTDNTTTFAVSNVNNVSLIFYSNDSSGNSNNDIVTWNYSVWQYDKGSRNSTTEGATELYYLDFIIKSGSLSTARLWYEGNDTLSSFTATGRRYNATIDNFIVPLTDLNKVSSLFWEIDYGSVEANSTTSTQHINALLIDNCGVQTHTLYNFTMRDEVLLNALKNTTAKLNIQIYGYSTNTLIEDYNTTYTKVNPFLVCLSSNFSSGESYSHDVQIQYESTNYTTRLYHIQNETINITDFPTVSNLYNLNATKSQVFKIIFRDSSFLPVEDALIKVYRKYVDENKYRIIEIPKTDEKGETLAHLVLNEVIYRLEVVKYGVILETFNDVLAVCQTPLVQDCKIDLNAFSESIVIPDFEEAEDFSFTLGYDNSTRIISSIFSIPSGEVRLVTLNVTRYDALGTSGCSDSLYSSAGTLSCVVPSSFGNESIKATLYVSGVEQAFGSINLRPSPSGIYGVNLVILGLFIMLTLIGLGMSDDPVYSVLFLLVGVALLFGLNLVANNGFIGAGATILWIVIAIILVAVKGSRRNV